MKGFVIGLRTEIVLNVAALMTGGTLLMGFVVLQVSEQAVLDQKVKSTKAVLNSIQSSLRQMDTVPAVDYEAGAQRLIDIFMEGEGIHSIIITDRGRRVIAHSFKEEVGKTIRDEALARSISDRTVTTSVEKGVVSVSAPVYLKAEVTGGIKIILSAGDVEAAAAKSQRLILFYAVLNSLALVIFGSVLLSRTIVRPIDKLVDATEAVANGDFSRRIMVTRFNEIGRLSESVNTMTERLRDGKESLESHIRRLEDAHKELERAQNEVIMAEKMASVGRLAAGIAHEVGNPLSAILGYTEILQSGGVSSEVELEYLKRIEAEIQRINRIIRGLLDYARHGGFMPEEINANEVIREALDLVSTQKSFERIEMRTDLKDLPPVQADPHQLQQVLINFLLNAADAMPDGGTISVFSGEKEQTHEVMISVTDTGTGMDREEIKRIFDPFFTTKEPGKGTGLGLSICQRIIESFGGRIEVESEKGRGSTFTILLPAGEDRAI